MAQKWTLCAPVLCGYLSPSDVLRAFHDYDQRLYDCIFEYRQVIVLANYSYSDLKQFLNQYSKEELQPTTLILSFNLFECGNMSRESQSTNVNT